MRFAERMSLTSLSHPISSTVDAALRAIAAVVHLQARYFSQEHYRALREAFAQLSGNELVILGAFADRCLRVVRDPRLPEHVHLNHLWGIVALRTEDSLVTLFRVINEIEKTVRPTVLRQAALALACHTLPHSEALVHRTIRLSTRPILSSECREALESGLVAGTMLRIAWLFSEAGSTGTFPTNQMSPTKKFHHLKLMRHMISQNLSRTLRERAVEEVGKITDPSYLWQHPLVAPCMSQYTPLHIPAPAIELLREAVTHPDPRTQRAAVRALRGSYRDGEGPEGAFVKEVLGGIIGGLDARREVEAFLEHLPHNHVRDLRRAATALTKSARQ